MRGRSGLKNKVEATELAMEGFDHHHNIILAIHSFGWHVKCRPETRKIAKDLCPYLRDSALFIISVKAPKSKRDNVDSL